MTACSMAHGAVALQAPDSTLCGLAQRWAAWALTGTSKSPTTHRNNDPIRDPKQCIGRLYRVARPKG
jgi:hypothetical protein